MTNILRAAWVPDDDPHRDWEIAAQLAVDWIREECADQRANGVLVLNAFGAEQSVPALRRFTAQHAATTPRAGRNRADSGLGPVLAYVPTERTLDFAAGLARGSSLAVVEGSSSPLEGRARELGAVDLTRPDETPTPIESALTAAIGRLHFYSNNSFSVQFGKQRAQRILEDLRGEDLLDRELILGALVARGVSDRGVRNLDKLIESVVSGDSSRTHVS
ncbi:hypothetical protein [Streptodolium elevatio]|uniref:Uncharacterized protein n=1 Tax=Streptodolium elevatio TaxID=3157996 RepID=A0ABV3DSC0_9ACTN